MEILLHLAINIWYSDTQTMALAFGHISKVEMILAMFSIQYVSPCIINYIKVTPLHDDGRDGNENKENSRSTDVHVL